MTILAPAFLTWQSLPAFAWMRTPVWVFDYDRLRTVWANAAGLELWRAHSVAELSSRDCADLSPSARNLLAGLLAALRRGESSTSVPWTLYPNGMPTSITITPTGILLEDGRLGILAEGQPLTGERLSASLRRDLDALNHTSAQISIHSLLEAQDVTAAVLGEQQARTEKQLLEMISAGERLPRILDTLVRGVEALRPDLLCSVLLLDDNGQLHCTAAPSLPASYTAAIEGMAIGPSAGSCGTAAWRGETVVASDIALDPLWADYQELALRHGLRACWAVCITASTGKVLGTFAAYYRSPRAPTSEDLRLLDTARHIAGISIERVRSQEAVEQRERQLRAVMDSVPAMICHADTQMRDSSMPISAMPTGWAHRATS